jgi:penicillin-insensitive murein endopeptidase
VIRLRALRGAAVAALVVALVAAAAATAKSSRPHRRAKHVDAAPAWKTAAAWSSVETPKAGVPRVFGFYSAGCMQGAVPLPPSGPGYELLHPARRRYFGHPVLVDYVRRLAAAAVAKGYPMLLVGDLAQPRGGPTPSDHGSHQSGLDVDIAYTRPVASLWQPIPFAEREGLQPPAVVDIEARKKTGAWAPWIPGLLELAASDPSVERIFVNPLVKREMCRAEPGAEWLGRLRPWLGHHDHFHVRLRCPAGSPGCRAQEPPPPGDGCEEAESWIERASAPPPEHRPWPARQAALPPQCRQILR